MGWLPLALGACAALVGGALVIRSLTMAALDRRGARTEGRLGRSRVLWSGAVLLGGGLYAIAWPGDDETTTTGLTESSERVLFGVIGTLAIGAAVVMWVYAGELSARYGKTRQRAESDDTARDAPGSGETLVKEGPLSVLVNAFLRRLGMRRVALLVAAFGVVYVAGVLWPSAPRAAIGASDALLAVGDLLLLLIWLGFAVLCVVLGATQRKWVVVVIGVAMLLAVLVVLSIRTGLLLVGSRGSGTPLPPLSERRDPCQSDGRADLASTADDLAVEGRGCCHANGPVGRLPQVGGVRCADDLSVLFDGRDEQVEVARIEVIETHELLFVQLRQQIGSLAPGELVYDLSDRLAGHPDPFDDVAADRDARRRLGVEEVREALEKFADEVGLDRLAAGQIALVGVVDEFICGDVGRQAVDEAVVRELEQRVVDAVGPDEGAADDGRVEENALVNERHRRVGSRGERRRFPHR